MSGLPAEFLSTPFGQAMRPQIDAMFRKTTPAERPIAGLPTPPPSGSSTPSTLLSSVATRATMPTPANTPTSETSPLTLVSSLSNFSSLLKQHSPVIANFTNTPGCAPCRAIKPVYESIAADYASYGAKGVRFVEIELGVGEGGQIASRHGVSATPTFIFFRDGKKVDELKGASKKELEMKVESFREDCFPRHPHRKLYLPGIEAMKTTAITSATTPAYPALLTKLESFGADKAKMAFLRETVVPALQGSSLTDPQLSEWISTSNSLLSSLPPEATFPVIDLWRVAFLDPKLAASLTLLISPAQTRPAEPISPILALADSTLSTSGSTTSKPFLLTVLRFLTSLLAPLPLSNVLLSSSSPLQAHIVSILVESLLHSDTSVRSAAAGVAFNLATWSHRLANHQGRGPEELHESEWEVEVISALVEAIDRETDEDVAHRLLGALGFLIYLSPGYSATIQPLLDVLGARAIIEGKVKGYKKKEVRKLAEEIATKLCI